MIGRRLGLVLVLTFSVAVVAGALVEGFRLDDQLSRERASVDALNQRQHAAALALSNLRGAQAAYFAAGQGPAFWQTRATEASARVEESITDLQAQAVSDSAKPHYQAAMAALGSLNGLDQKARDELAQESDRTAADTVFTEAAASATQLESEIMSAGADEASVRGVRIGRLQTRHVQVEAAALGALLLAVLVLGFLRRPPVAVAAPLEEPLALRSTIPAVAPPPVRPPADSPAPSLDLASASQICVDLARVLDSQDLPPILGRAAAVLGAKGIVLWVADTSGALLRPSLAHGYSDRVLQRLGPLQADADNVTSLAFRSMQPQTLADAARGTPNAIAVPLISATGCTGVLSAEVTSGQAGADIVAIARMFAAQLATLVTPSETALDGQPHAEPAAGQ